MKKLLALLLSCLLLLSTGCGKAPDAVPTDSHGLSDAISRQTIGTSEPIIPESEGIQITVHNVDELLAAIGSDRTILLEPGIYDISTARDFGDTVESPWCYWQPTDGSYYLMMREVRGMTLQSAGEEPAVITTSNPTGSVLELEYCENIVLRNLRIGHTGQTNPEYSAAIRFFESQSLTLENLDLYNCGDIGVGFIYSQNTEIFDCSISGITGIPIYANNCFEGTILNCTIRDSGRPLYPAYAAFYLENIGNFFIGECSVTGNLFNILIQILAEDGDPTVFDNVSFTDNRVTDYAFYFHESAPIFSQVDFDRSTVRAWYSDDSESAVDPDGFSLDEIDFPERTPYEEGPRTVVHAATVDELLNAIGSNREICLDSDFYDLAQASGYGTEDGPCYFWDPSQENFGLVIHDVENLAIFPAEGVMPVITAPQDAGVMAFAHCTGVQLSGLTFGRSEEPMEYEAPILQFFDDDVVTLNCCSLSGTGWAVFYAAHSRDFSILDSRIFGPISMFETDYVRLDGVEGLSEEALSTNSCDFVTVDGVARNP